MKLDTNNKSVNNETENFEEVIDPRQNAEDIIDGILSEIIVTNSPNSTRNNEPAENLLEMIQSNNRTPLNSFSDHATIDDIDPTSNLGMSIRNKCQELEGILQSLKSRLNHVVLDENIVLGSDVDSLEAQLEYDLDTDCQEELSLQEFLELVHSQNAVAPTQQK